MDRPPIEELIERSKNDHLSKMIVGSEVRAVAGYALDLESNAKAQAETIERLRKALRSVESFTMSVGYKFDHAGAMNSTQLDQRDHYKRIRHEIHAALGEESPMSKPRPLSDLELLQIRTSAWSVLSAGKMVNVDRLISELRALRKAARAALEVLYGHKHSENCSAGWCSMCQREIELKALLPPEESDADK